MLAQFQRFNIKELMLNLITIETGHGAMEASVCNLVEPGDTVMVGVNGLWGERFSDMADRHCK